MKTLFSLQDAVIVVSTFISSLVSTVSISQNVGIGTNNPTYKLHVEGDIFTSGQLRVWGYGNFLNRIQIGSGGSYEQNYNLHVQGDTYLTNLNIGSAGTSLGSNKLRVNGNTLIQGNLDLNGSLNAEGSISAYNLTAANILNTPDMHVTNSAWIDNDAIVGGNFRTNGRVGINGSTNANYGLIVNNANCYFQGNTTTTGTATVNGNLNAQGDLTIKGNGHVRSQGPSNLKVGFKSKSLNDYFAVNGVKEYTITLDEFDAGNSDIRVMISQFDPDPAAAYQNWRYFDFKIYDIDPLTNSCRLVIFNGSGIGTSLKGVIYLTTISKE